MIENEFTKKRKEFLNKVVFCSLEQMGILFLLIKNNQLSAIGCNAEGEAVIKVEEISDRLLERLSSQLEMWNISLTAPVAGKKK